jgi:hypothetical protein
MDLITFNCSACQQVLKVGAENAGKQAKCPRCGTALVIPSASAGGSKTNPRPAPPPPPARKYREEEPFEDIQQPPARPARARPADEEYEEERRPRPRRRDDDYDDEERPARARRRDDDYDDEERPARARRRGDDDDDDRRDRPRRRAERYEEEDEEDFDRPRRGGMSPRKRWGFVQLGVLLVAISACVLAGAGALHAVADLIRLIQILGDKGSGDTFKVLSRIGNGLMFVAGLAALAGYVFCVFVPNKYGTLVFAIVAIVLGVINLVFNLLCKIIPMMRETMAGGRELELPGAALISTSLGGAFAFSLIIVLFYFAEFIVFPLFLWAAARAVRARWAAGSAMGLVVFAGVTAGLALINVVMWFIAMNQVVNALQSGQTPSKGLVVTASIVSLIAALVFVGFMVWYLLVLFRTRNTLDVER